MSASGNPTKTERFEEAVRYVEGCAASARPGQALPSLRDMIAASGFTRAYLCRAVRHLADGGQLVVKPRGGVFRAGGGQPQGVVDVIACCELNYIGVAGHFFPDLLEHFHQEAERRNLGIRLRRVKPDDDREIYRRLARLKDTDGFFLLKPDSVDLVWLFGAAERPAVFLYPRMPLPPCRQILDSPLMLDTQLGHLFAKGHRRIAYLAYPDISSQLRRESYYRIMAERGLRVEPCWVRPECDDERGLFASLDEMFSVEPLPTALIANDISLPTVYRFLERRGFEIGKDFSVLGTDGVEVSARIHPAADTVLNPRDLAAAAAWRMFDEARAGKQTPESWTVPLTLVPRLSTHVVPDGGL